MDSRQALVVTLARSQGDKNKRSSNSSFCSFPPEYPTLQSCPSDTNSKDDEDIGKISCSFYETLTGNSWSFYHQQQRCTSSKARFCFCN